MLQNQFFLLNNTCLSLSLIDFLSLDLDHAEKAWDEWEIHCLILVSLSLQVFLSLTADLRRRSASRVLSNALWLAYVSADSVAVFILGHLAVHAQGPSHDLMLFWAPFALVHLGGQDSITAFSKQDNELWTRHLLGLVTQTAVAGYVVSRSSWPDARLRAAMVLIFLCGFLKYAGRTLCLYSASPMSLRVLSLVSLSRRLGLRLMHDARDFANLAAKERFEEMFPTDDRSWECIKEIHVIGGSVDDIMFVDAPDDDDVVTLATAEVLGEIKDRPADRRCVAYRYVAASLGQFYQLLYTKAPLLSKILGYWVPDTTGHDRLTSILFILITYTLFQSISTAIALVLFASARKEGHHSKADIIVSYILLVGALVLDLLPACTSIVSYVRKPFRPTTVVECAAMICKSCLQPPGWRTRKQWSEELAQYSMIKRYTSVQGYYACLTTSFWSRILERTPFATWCAELLDLKRTEVTDDLKLFILDRLLLLQTRRDEWDFASFRGERALGRWIISHEVPQLAEWSGYVLQKSLSRRVEFPTSVLIWHIATDICYFSEDNGRRDDNEPDETKTRKKLSREISHYIMYLVFKCDVMLTRNSRLVHTRAHEELAKYFPHDHLDEKETTIMLFDAMKEDVEEYRPTQDAAAINATIEELLWTTVGELHFPVLPLACVLAQDLISIQDEAGLWELISEVWLEKFFYMAPRCGAAFHYEHLSTGGEFITHVLLLMRFIGPFMPKSGA
ncbi:unnamed protein product [Miscanthus lutarioriparius]|uniref:DUF4220 domain-containing protein n=1 Tax=Miscanthus lutarioriparius TaxID=422564 RepID=A0A811Q468_9POAL|nr:unnamed protein product [Miscanthus lutarioriparius]